MYQQSDRSPTEVLVVGAGPTGLTLALELARRGIAFRLIEQQAEPFEGSRGKGLQPRTLEVFDDLGVIEEILAAGSLYPALRIHFGPLSIPWRSLGSAHAPTASVPYPNLWMVPQDRTEAILEARLVALGGAVERSLTLESFVQTDEQVIATLSNGERVAASFLVGCDGGHSLVRKALGLPLHGETIGESQQLVADVLIDGFDRRTWQIWPLARGGLVGLCPLPHTERLQFIGPATAQHALEETIERTTGHAVRSVVWQSMYLPQVRMVDRYRVGRVLIAGDAAHLHPPAGGQGLNTGVQDAYNLGWKLAHVVRGGPVVFLDSYDLERRPIAAAVLGLSKRLHLAQSTKRGALTSQLALDYRRSPLSSGKPLGSLPIQATACQTRRSGMDARLHEQLRGAHATSIELDPRTRILVRPDGYIATIGQENVREYAGVPNPHSVIGWRETWRVARATRG